MRETYTVHMALGSVRSSHFDIFILKDIKMQVTLTQQSNCVLSNHYVMVIS